MDAWHGSLLLIALMIACGASSMVRGTMVMWIDVTTVRSKALTLARRRLRRGCGSMVVVGCFF